MNKTTSARRQPSARVEQKRQQARQEILEIAEQLLHEGGVDAVTLASVAGRLNMTKQALYHYFQSKEALTRSLVTALLNDEVEALIKAVEASDEVEKTLSTVIRAFYDHYIHRLEAFRTVYCQSQLHSGTIKSLDKVTLRDEINPRTNHLFDLLEERISGAAASDSKRRRKRQLAFTAWTSALGLMTMLGIADATDDPLVHADEELLDSLEDSYDRLNAM